MRRGATTAALAALAALAVLAAATPARAERTGPGPAGGGGSPGQTFRDCPHCPEMVVAAPGTFDMGDASAEAADARPVRRVTIGHRFAFGKAKVTSRDWRRCVLAGQCRSLGASARVGAEPVVLVSWVDAQQYVLWLTLETGLEYRLLSEAEWEYLARSGPAAFGSDGLEWTSDCWHPDYVGAPTDGSSWEADGDCRYHVARGARPGEAAAAVTRRYRFLYTAGDPALGFRVARTLRD